MTISSRKLYPLDWIVIALFLVFLWMAGKQLACAQGWVTGPGDAANEHDHQLLDEPRTGARTWTDPQTGVVSLCGGPGTSCVVSDSRDDMVSSDGIELRRRAEDDNEHMFALPANADCALEQLRGGEFMVCRWREEPQE